MAHPMGEAKLEPLRVDFDRRLKLEFHGRDDSSDASLLPYRELDDALGPTERFSPLSRIQPLRDSEESAIFRKVSALSQSPFENVING